MKPMSLSCFSLFCADIRPTRCQEDTTIAPLDKREFLSDSPRGRDGRRPVQQSSRAVGTACLGFRDSIRFAIESGTSFDSAVLQVIIMRRAAERGADRARRSRMILSERLPSAS
jgi:hypothetical protein